MKVISSKQMAHMESLAYRDGASESDFMEEAGSGVALVVNDYIEDHQLDRRVLLLCGKGNNAGDAYVAGIHLLHLEYEVYALQLAPISECSSLCKENHRRFLQEGGHVKEVDHPEDVVFPLNGVIVDGIFGTGFHGTVKEPYASIIELANQSKLPIIAVDIPSGLNGENGEVQNTAIIAAETAFLGLPKTGFFLRDGWNHSGKLRYVDFGLAHEYIEETDADFLMLSNDMLKPLFPPLIRNRHKYQAGYVVGLAGSPGMPGAAILSTLASLRGGAGIVRLLYPAGMEVELASSPYELIKMAYAPTDIHTIVETLNKASAVFIGPGLGRSEQVKKLLREVLPSIQKPCVIDADALFFLAEEEVSLPAHAILTPHMGEFARLLKISRRDIVDKDFLKVAQNYAENNRITLVLKGGPSFIFHPDEQIRVNPTGDPGMATAGSGDVLTGLLAALLAQGLATHEAASLGVYLHGIAGEYAANELTSYSMTASDILFYFPEAFKECLQISSG
jgi:hydroxyethylthiazole kinase-like uncharacterized protein yjeF